MLMEFYAAESVTYLTAGIQDWYENQDVDIESAIVKVCIWARIVRTYFFSVYFLLDLLF